MTRQVCFVARCICQKQTGLDTSMVEMCWVANGVPIYQIGPLSASMIAQADTNYNQYLVTNQKGQLYTDLQFIADWLLQVIHDHLWTMTAGCHRGHDRVYSQWRISWRWTSPKTGIASSTCARLSKSLWRVWRKNPSKNHSKVFWSCCIYIVCSGHVRHDWVEPDLQQVKDSVNDLEL